MSNNPKSANFQDADIAEARSGRASARAGAIAAAVEGTRGSSDFTAEEIAAARALLARKTT